MSQELNPDSLDSESEVLSFAALFTGHLDQALGGNKVCFTKSPSDDSLVIWSTPGVGK
jgi:hypothetical protein